MKSYLIKLLVAVFLASGGLFVTAKASIVAFEWNEGSPGTNSNYFSHHNAIGPVLADDFNPAVGGWVSSVTWWGSAAASDVWEITFHSDATNPASGLHEPAYTAPSGGLSQHFVNATGVDPDGDQVFEYTALWTPQDLALTAGATYWFSVANSLSGWTWALTDGVAPSVGSESHAPTQSVGGLPSIIAGPHDGPWSPILDGTDFAFKINVVPVPAAVWLFGTALIGLLGFGRRKQAA